MHGDDDPRDRGGSSSGIGPGAAALRRAGDRGVTTWVRPPREGSKGPSRRRAPRDGGDGLPAAAPYFMAVLSDNPIQPLFKKLAGNLCGIFIIVPLEWLVMIPTDVGTPIRRRRPRPARRWCFHSYAPVPSPHPFSPQEDPPCDLRHALAPRSSSPA